MKPRLLLLALVLGLAACQQTQVPGLAPIAFSPTRESFASGDLIVIREVLAPRAELAPGDRVVVRGDYRLGSRAEAKLGLSLTTLVRSGPTPVLPASRQAVSAGQGTFTLETEIRQAGALHVSFYPAGSGSSFGGIYFATVRP